MTTNIDKREYSITSFGMEFCEVCDNLLKPKKIDDAVVPYCEECDTISKSSTIERYDISSDLDELETLVDNREIEVKDHFDDENQLQTKKHCPECDIEQEVLYVHTRSATADEGIVKEFTCLECKHTWSINF